MERYIQMLKEFIIENCSQMTREPSHILKYPYTVPSSPNSPYYSMTLWDWDSWFISVVMGQMERDTGEKGRFFEYEAGCVRNYLDHTGEDGVVPIQISDKGIMSRRLPGRGPFDENMHKPMLVQQAAMLVQRSGDVEWVKPLMEKLGLFVNRYLTSHIHRETGLAYWQSDFAVGVDNDPSVFYRPDKSCGSIYLNSLLYRELLAYGYLWEMLGEVKEANLWRKRAQELAGAVQTHCWDERDGTFYSVDLNLRPIDPEDWLHRGAPRTWNSLLLRVDNWSSFLPMWAGIATRAQAERMLELEHGPDDFALRVSAVSVGDIALVGIPGEPFSDIGRDLKEAPGWPLVLPCCCTNGYEGYFPPMNAYENGSYETRSSIFRSGVAEAISGAGLELLETMKQ